MSTSVLSTLSRLVLSASKRVNVFDNAHWHLFDDQRCGVKLRSWSSTLDVRCKCISTVMTVSRPSDKDLLSQEVAYSDRSRSAGPI